MDTVALFNLTWFKDQFILLAVFGLFAVAGFFLAVAAIIQQRRGRAELSELQARLAQLEASEQRRIVQFVNRPPRRRRSPPTEAPSTGDGTNVKASGPSSTSSA